MNPFTPADAEKLLMCDSGDHSRCTPDDCFAERLRYWREQRTSPLQRPRHAD